MPALEALADAVQAFANEDEDEAVIVQAAVVVYEVTRFTEDGDQTHRICYTVPRETAMSATIGLLDAGLHMVRADAVADTEDIP